MARDSSNEVQYYYDYHPTEEDLMGETSWHANLVDYLKAVLSWLFHGQVCTIHGNLNFYQTLNPREYPLAPDLVIIKGLEFKHKRSWTVGKTGPTPQVIFEVLSEETWKGEMVKITPNQQGWLWSEQLESWLVPDETYLRLYDREHRLRLTGEEAQARLA